MRKVVLFNDGWTFMGADKSKVGVTLPHTWNAFDGQDGGNDYYRGMCEYKKYFDTPSDSNEKCYIEFQGVNSSAFVNINGSEVAVHHGGYSTFRADISDHLLRDSSQNELVVKVDNGNNDFVYPQKADFTFYGGIYRDVYLITAPKVHFDLDYSGGCGLSITPHIEGNKAVVELSAYVTGNAGSVRFSIEGLKTVTALINDGKASGEIIIENVHLWNGIKDPYQYTAKAELLDFEGQILDTVFTSFGCRTFSFDPQNGFLLNGDLYPLRGVSRHQDRKGVGNAITKEMMEEDISLIMEMGANTVRLAHYQHDQYFYDLCDRYGIVVWAEIPYISEHMPNGNANTISQLTELITQNYNHPSIFCWNLSNEITVTNITDDLRDNHKRLNELAHKLDPTRPTAMAHVTFLHKDDPLVQLTDICSYNHYFGWYFGELEDNDNWFDEFHAKYPNRIVGISEYGADANPRYHSDRPEKGDYSEEYQCIYHEHLLNMIVKRPYLWATHVWNMFDFGADGRTEGGNTGINQKGLVSFDRKIKKDAFYLYKAYLSEESFVHICGSRYIGRPCEITEVKVYSNQPEVTLFLDGVKIETKSANKVFCFSIQISGKHTIEAVSGDIKDIISIEKVAEKNLDYALANRAINNWYETDGMEFPQGYYSIKDTLGDIKQTPDGKALIDKMMDVARAERGDVAQGLEHNEVLEKMMKTQTVENLIKQAGGSITTEMAISLNTALNKIKKDSSPA